MPELIDNPLVFATKEHTGGKLRVFGTITVMLPGATPEDPPVPEEQNRAFAFLINYFDRQKTQMEYWEVESLPAAAKKEPFTWETFASRFHDTPDVDEVLKEWGDIDLVDWYPNIASGTDKLMGVHVTDDVTLELRSGYDILLGQIGYVKIVLP